MEPNYPNPQISGESKPDSDKELFYNEAKDSLAACFELPRLKAIDNALLTLLLPSVIATIMGNMNNRNYDTVGLLASGALLPVTIPLAAGVTGATLFYEGCLFTKKKIQQQQESAVPVNVERKHP